MKSARVCGCSPNTADARFCPSPGLFRIILCAITSVPHFLVTVNIFYKKLVNPYLTSQDSCDNINPSTRILLNQTPRPRGASQFRTSRKHPNPGQAEIVPKEGGVCGGNLSGFPLRDSDQPARKRPPYSRPSVWNTAPPPPKQKTRRSVLFVLVGEGGFEPPKSVTTDLQSAPFDRSGTPPYEILELVDGFEPPTC